MKRRPPILESVLVVLLVSPLAGAQGTAPASATAELEAIEAMISQGQLAQAERRLGSAAERFDSVRALLRLARLQADRDDLAAAAAALERARALAPNSEEVLGASAEMLLAAGSVLEAVEILDSLTRLCPSVAAYLSLQGRALLQAGDAAAAAESLAEAIRREGDDVPGLIALGAALIDRGRYQDARGPLLRATSLAPESLDAVAALAQAEQGLGELEAAEARAVRVLGRAATHARANLVLGMIRLRQERLAEARDALLAAVAAGAASPLAHRQLSEVYARLGEAAESQRHLELCEQGEREAGARLAEVRAVTAFSTDGTSP